MGKKYLSAKVIRILAFALSGVLAKAGVDSAAAEGFYSGLAELIVSAILLIGTFAWSIAKDKLLRNSTPPGTLAVPIKTLDALQAKAANGPVNLADLMAAFSKDLAK